MVAAPGPVAGSCPYHASSFKWTGDSLSSIAIRGRSPGDRHNRRPSCRCPRPYGTVEALSRLDFYHHGQAPPLGELREGVGVLLGKGLEEASTPVPYADRVYRGVMRHRRQGALRSRLETRCTNAEW